MKIVIRTLIILAAALAVAGAAYALSQAGYLGTLLPAGQEHAEMAGAAAAGATAAQHTHGDSQGGLASAVSILKNLGVVAAAVVALGPVRRLLYGRPHRRPPSPPLAAPSA